MEEKDLSLLVGEVIRKHRKDESGKKLSRRIIADKLGFQESYLTQIEAGTKTSMFTFFRVLACLPTNEAKEAWREFLAVALPAFDLARIVETGEEQGKDHEKLARIRALLEE